MYVMRMLHPQDLQADMNIDRYDPDLDRWRMSNPHEDLLAELQEELRRYQFAKQCLEPVQIATQGVIENCANRSLVQV